jgi:hypothetical protein
MTATATATSTLFRQGWKAELYFGDDVTAHHMNTRSVYTFKVNPNITITHSAPYGVNGDWETSVDQFIVSETHSHQYHESGALFTSVTETVGTFRDWLGAYYCALERIRQLGA